MTRNLTTMGTTRIKVGDKHSAVWNILGKSANPWFFSYRCPAGPLHVHGAVVVGVGHLEAASLCCCCHCRACIVACSFHVCTSRRLRDRSRGIWVAFLPFGFGSLCGGGGLLTALRIARGLGGFTGVLRSDWRGSSQELEENGEASLHLLDVELEVAHSLS
jgi:hypothetical protein